MKNITIMLLPILFLSCTSNITIEDHINYLQANKDKAGVVVTDSGLQYEQLRDGSGNKPSENSKVTLHYIARNIDGSIFDNSYTRGKPPSFVLNGAIRGLVEEVQLMPVGSKFRFVVPAALAYGNKGAANEIKPNSTYQF